ncbi:hypothetical protein ACHAQH_001847 [Verticillium albo-atrum]
MSNNPPQGSGSAYANHTQTNESQHSQQHLQPIIHGIGRQGHYLHPSSINVQNHYQGCQVFQIHGSMTLPPFSPLLSAQAPQPPTGVMPPQSQAPIKVVSPNPQPILAPSPVLSQYGVSVAADAPRDSEAPIHPPVRDEQALPAQPKLQQVNQFADSESAVKGPVGQQPQENGQVRHESGNKDSLNDQSEAIRTAFPPTDRSYRPYRPEHRQPSWTPRGGKPQVELMQPVRVSWDEDFFRLGRGLVTGSPLHVSPAPLTDSSLETVTQDWLAELSDYLEQSRHKLASSKSLNHPPPPIFREHLAAKVTFRNPFQEPLPGPKLAEREPLVQYITPTDSKQVRPSPPCSPRCLASRRGSKKPVQLVLDTKKQVWLPSARQPTARKYTDGENIYEAAPRVKLPCAAHSKFLSTNNVVANLNATALKCRAVMQAFVGQPHKESLLEHVEGPLASDNYLESDNWSTVSRLEDPSDGEDDDMSTQAVKLQAKSYEGCRGQTEESTPTPLGMDATSFPEPSIFPSKECLDRLFSAPKTPAGLKPSGMSDTLLRQYILNTEARDLAATREITALAQALEAKDNALHAAHAKNATALAQKQAQLDAYTRRLNEILFDASGRGEDKLTAHLVRMLIAALDENDQLGGRVPNFGAADDSDETSRVQLLVEQLTKQLRLCNRELDVSNDRYELLKAQAEKQADEAEEWISEVKEQAQAKFLRFQKQTADALILKGQQHMATISQSDEERKAFQETVDELKRERIAHAETMLELEMANLGHKNAVAEADDAKARSLKAEGLADLYLKDFNRKCAENKELLLNMKELEGELLANQEDAGRMLGHFEMELSIAKQEIRRHRMDETKFRCSSLTELTRKDDLIEELIEKADESEGDLSDARQENKVLRSQLLEARAELSQSGSPMEESGTSSDGEGGSSKDQSSNFPESDYSQSEDEGEYLYPPLPLSDEEDEKPSF